MAKQVKMGGGTGGRFFDEHGLARENFASSGSTDLYRITNPIADREESDRPYEENVWVRAAVKAISEGFQRLKLTVYNGDPSDDGATEVPKHPLFEMLKRPNRIMTSRGLWRGHAVNHKLDGEEIWFLMDASGNPVESDENGVLLSLPVTTLPVRGSLVELQYDEMGMPSTYRYTTSFSKNSGNTSPVFPAGSVVHFRDYDPYNVTRGLGDVQSLARETDLYFQAFRAMDGAIRNGGDPGGFIIFNHPVDGEELRRRQDIADEEFAGPNQRRIKLLEDSAKFVPNNVKPSDMQYPELLTWIRDSILSGLGCPPPVVGIYDAATMNNVDTAYRELWTGSNGILSMASMTADCLTNDLMPRLARVGGSEEQVAFFDSSSIEALKEDIADRLVVAADIASKGVAVSFNEALEMQGVEVEQPKEGDRRWVAGSLTDLDDPEAGKPELPEPAEDGEAGDGEESDEVVEAESDSSDSETPGGDEASENAVTDLTTFAQSSPPSELELKIKSKVSGWLAAYEAAQLKRLRSIAANRLNRWSIFDELVNPEALTEEAWQMILLENAPWASKLSKSVRKELRAVYLEALKVAHGEAGGAIVAMTDPSVIEHLALQELKLSGGVTAVTQRRIRNAIARVFAGSAAPGDLRNVIKQALPELTQNLKQVFGSKDARASAIARTERGHATNGARYNQFQASNVDTIEWVTSVDDKARASHIGVHGTRVQIGGFFANGLRRPHDPLAPAGEVVNCRCTFRVASRRNRLDDPDIEIS
tara:strand:+ start:29163 stop:31448 length:2286 start_codon:yes stop_codon:yes gene_type:complete